MLNVLHAHLRQLRRSMHRVSSAGGMVASSAAGAWHGPTAASAPAMKRMLALSAITMSAASMSTSSTTSTSTTALCHAADDTCTVADATDGEQKEIFRKDYTPSLYLIPEMHMDFQLDASATILTTTSVVEPQANSNTDLVLDGEDCIDLKAIKINGVTVTPDDYKIEDETLRISSKVLPPVAFKLETVVQIAPDKNLQLAGLYASGKSLMTQCEALGFRRITYHLDRPDVLSKYVVRLEADKKAYPLLLSNGNLIKEGELGSGRHFAIWEDPFFKPSYLFAVVAGDLGSIHDTFITKSGKTVKLGLYSEHESVDKLDHAMDSLKRAMKWDEDTFNLECDLDVYNVVATADFNMGAMENKGLNIFNSAYVLAKPSTSTDQDYENVLGVIGHEYFHNWTGNRITVRDWFQLTLKEGLTVQRDQWFSSDMTGLAVKRIADIKVMRSAQFGQDAGPLAHPIRPESYVAMDNFYTVTVYNKGAEIVRMYRTLLGDDGFKKGMDLYVKRHDGQAVTCDEFRAAMGDANGYDTTQFARWYETAGTPVVGVETYFDAAKKTYTMRLTQRTPSTPGQKEENKKPLVIPVRVGLLSATTGAEILRSTVLTLSDSAETFVFENISEKPVLSFLRGFSAPVKVEMEQSDEELAFLMAHDTDFFNKWDASQRLANKLIIGLAAKKDVAAIEASELPAGYVAALRACLLSAGDKGDHALLSMSMQLPDLQTLALLIASEQGSVDLDALMAARKHVKKSLATALQPELVQVYESLAPKDGYKFKPEETGRRRLRGVVLDLLSAGPESEDAVAARAKAMYDSADNMTDKMMALAPLASKAVPERAEALAHFHDFANSDGLVLNKWFMLQAGANSPDTLARCKELLEHKDFTLTNPNRVRSILGPFCNNMPVFHAADGSGYEFAADLIIRIDAMNPQVAARMSNFFSQWKLVGSARGALMEGQLRRILAVEGLSKDTKEVITRTLG